MIINFYPKKLLIHPPSRPMTVNSTTTFGSCAALLPARSFKLENGERNLQNLTLSSLQTFPLKKSPWVRVACIDRLTSGQVGFKNLSIDQPQKVQGGLWNVSTWRKKKCQECLGTQTKEMKGIKIQVHHNNYCTQYSSSPHFASLTPHSSSKTRKKWPWIDEEHWPMAGVRQSRQSEWDIWTKGRKAKVDRYLCLYKRGLLHCLDVSRTKPAAARQFNSKGKHKPS